MLQYLVKPDPIQRVAYDRFGVLQLNLSRARNAGKSPDTRIRQPLHMLTRYLSHFATFSAVSRLRRKTERADAFCSVEAPFPSSRNTSQCHSHKKLTQVAVVAKCYFTLIAALMEVQGVQRLKVRWETLVSVLRPSPPYRSPYSEGIE